MAAILGPLLAAAAAFDLLAHALGYIVLLPSAACVLWWAHSRFRVWRRERGARWNVSMNAELDENTGAIAEFRAARVQRLAAALIDRSGTEVVSDLGRPSDFGVEELDLGKAVH